MFHVLPRHSGQDALPLSAPSRQKRRFLRLLRRYASVKTHSIDTNSVRPTLPTELGVFPRSLGLGNLNDRDHAPCPVVARRIVGAPVVDVAGMSATAQNWKPPAGNAPPVSPEFFPLIYEDLRRLASAAMGSGRAGQTLQPTALVHEAWLRLTKDADRPWRDRTHLFRAAAQTMRWILLDRARRRQSAKAGGGAEKVTIGTSFAIAPPPNDRLLAVNQCLERLEMEDPESARVITLKFFWGLTNREVAARLGVSERSVERKWAYAKVSLLDLLQRETGDFPLEGSETTREGAVRRRP